MKHGFAVLCIVMVQTFGLLTAGMAQNRGSSDIFDDQGAALFDALIGQQFRQMTTDITRRSAIENKLRGQVVEKVDFKNAGLQTVVDYVRKMSRDLDPEELGVNIVVTDAARQTAGNKTFSLNLNRVPLSAILRYSTQSLGVNYYVDEYAVVIDAPRTVGAAGMTPSPVRTAPAPQPVAPARPATPAAPATP